MKQDENLETQLPITVCARAELHPITVVERAVMAGDTVLGGLALPGFALGKLVASGGSGDAELGTSILFTILGWPITLPCLVVFGSI